MDSSAGSPGLVQQKMTMQLLTGIQLGPPRFPQIEMNPDHAKDLQEDLKSLNIGQFHFKWQSCLCDLSTVH